ncbi:MAG TPA: hypothetical protein VL096_12535 [Pirellulaceae bacterium]|nr:hypothetical protein [Pirellulaceae bacterium]
MKYWLRHPGATDFVYPLTLAEIRARIESGDLYLDCEALKATGQSLDEVRRSMGWVMLSAVLEPESVITPDVGQSPAAFRAMIRRQSCYGNLRELIAVCTGFSLLVNVVLAGICIMGGIRGGDGPLSIFSLLAGIFGCFLTILLYQVALMMVDIADTLIEQNRRKHDELDETA